LSSSPKRYPEGVLEVRRLGLRPYGEVHALQEELVDERILGRCGDVLILCEHDPVITLGRGSSADVAPTGPGAPPVIAVERGGEATYHGPGQLVAYPIFALREERRNLHRYLRDLEQVVIAVLAEVGIEGLRREGLTGVWVGELKICSIGVAVRRWVAWHGLALNVRTDLDAFRGFQPCGLDPSVMTRVIDHVPDLPPTNALLEVLTVKHFLDVFELSLPPLPRAPLDRPPEAGPGYQALPVLPS
jgi:lipoate-protein ligase B